MSNKYKTIIKTVLEFAYNGDVNLKEYKRTILKVSSAGNNQEYKIKTIDNRFSEFQYILSDNLNKVKRETSFNVSMAFEYYHIEENSDITKEEICHLLLEKAEEEIRYREIHMNKWKVNLFKGKINVVKENNNG